ncbi:hypothetical protein BDA96_03G065500 [Sorghum bicolor]|uniref:Uncharacterized protein n=1 Tax=Sorghum bicolor TaxID=4558 RepID=A0A921RCG4_SORBI|nr:hypothetical protein BDA96_03G065500 [Sorghum bicolor]
MGTKRPTRPAKKKVYKKMACMMDVTAVNLIAVPTVPTTRRRAQEPRRGRHLPSSTSPARATRSSRPGTPPPPPRASPRRPPASCPSSWPARAARARALPPRRRASAAAAPCRPGRRRGCLRSRASWRRWR